MFLHFLQESFHATLILKLFQIWLKYPDFCWFPLHSSMLTSGRQITWPCFTDDLFQSDDALAWPVWVDYLTNISHLTTTINSSVNFYIYVAKYSNYSFQSGSSTRWMSRKQTIKKVLCKTNQINHLSCKKMHYGIWLYIDIYVNL